MDLPPDFHRHAAGPAGALTALLWLPGTWPRRVGMLLAGSVLSYYMTPAASAWVEMPESLTGYLLGLFGMAAVNKLFSTWDTFDLGGLLQQKFGMKGNKEGE